MVFPLRIIILPNVAELPREIIGVNNFDPREIDHRSQFVYFRQRNCRLSYRLSPSSELSLEAIRKV